jgi:hypothetical protein
MKRMSGIEAKKLLKQHGINTKAVKVINDGRALRVTVLSKEVCRDKIKEILSPMESVNRCEYTGDILSGGNFFVFVDYHWSLIV